MRKCIIKHEQPLGPSLCQALEDVDGVIDLIKVIQIKPPVMLLAWFEDNVCLTIKASQYDVRER
jgi:hypothetical protein